MTIVDDTSVAATSEGSNAPDDAVADRGDGSPAPAPTAGTTIGITFKLYATLQHLLPAGAKRNASAIEVASDVTLHEIIDRFQVPREQAHLVLVNGLFQCDADRDERGRLKEGDVLAIWPPVAGG